MTNRGDYIKLKAAVKTKEISRSRSGGTADAPGSGPGPLLAGRGSNPLFGTSFSEKVKKLIKRYYFSIIENKKKDMQK